MSQMRGPLSYKLRYDPVKAAEILYAPFYTTDTRSRQRFLATAMGVSGIVLCLILLQNGFDWGHIALLFFGFFAGYLATWIIAYIPWREQKNYIQSYLPDDICQLTLDETELVAQSPSFEYKFHWNKIADMSLRDGFLVIIDQHQYTAVLAAEGVSNEKRNQMFHEILTFWQQKKAEQN